MHRCLTRRLAIGLVLVAAVTACSDGGDEDEAAEAAARSTSSTTAPEGDAPAVTEGDPEARAAIELRGDGLGVVDLGAVPDEAIGTVSAALGQPTADSGWEEAASTTYGTCPGSRIRGVEWEHLVLLFTDGETEHGSGEHLFAWRVTGAPPALGTAQGLGYQATAADAEELYPGQVQRTEADEPFPGFLTVAVDGGPITAYLDGDVITNLEAGAPCGE